jgi:DNA-binding NtrC family response regulator
VLLDLQMPGVTGLDVLRTISNVGHSCRVVLMSGYATIDSAVEAVKLGAEDYVTKPFDPGRSRLLETDRTLSLRAFERALQPRRLPGLHEAASSGELLTTSPNFQPQRL